MARKPTAPKLSVVAPVPAPEHPAPPGKLGETGLALWRSVVESYEFSDPGSTQILYQACRSADRAEACREIIDTDGELMRTKTGARSHPLLRDELNNRRCARDCSVSSGSTWSRCALPPAGRLVAERADETPQDRATACRKAHRGGDRGLAQGRLLGPARRARS